MLLLIYIVVEDKFETEKISGNPFKFSKHSTVTINGLLYSFGKSHTQSSTTNLLQSYSNSVQFYLGGFDGESSFYGVGIYDPGSGIV